MIEEGGEENGVERPRNVEEKRRQKEREERKRDEREKEYTVAIGRGEYEKTKSHH